MSTENSCLLVAAKQLGAKRQIPAEKVEGIETD